MPLQEFQSPTLTEYSPPGRRLAGRPSDAFARVGLGLLDGVGFTVPALEKLGAAVAGLKARGFKAAGYSADVRNYSAVDAAIQLAVSTFGSPYILVCGAAGSFPAPALGLSSNRFKAVVDLDLDSIQRRGARSAMAKVLSRLDELRSAAR